MVEEKDIGWYNPNYIVGYGKLGGVEVRTPGRKKLYRGGFNKDLWSPEIQEKFPHREKNFIKSKNFYHLTKDQAMNQVHQDMIVKLQKEIDQIDAEMYQLKNRMNDCMIHRTRIEGKIEGLQDALQEMDKVVSASGQPTTSDSVVVDTISPEDMEKFEKQQKDEKRKAKVEFMKV